ncbi:hypothetical protein [Priestia megaterium]|nr:hypothetical protein [Priestia megaterium]MED4274072.1 hypothetical protein [Priestia megaterium]MED4319438.1 hypothetical protein [Priestia megaterium]
MDNNDEPIYIHEPNDSEEDGGDDKAGGKVVDKVVDKIEAVVVC